MTYQQLEQTMTVKEKKINKLLNFMKVNEDGYWDPKSVWNKYLYKFIKRWFHVDPMDLVVSWIAKLDDGCLYVVGENYTVNSASEEARVLKEAFNQ